MFTGINLSILVWYTSILNDENYQVTIHYSMYLIIQNTVTYLSFAAASKLFAATATYPYQVMRTRMQDQFQDYKGFIDVFNQTWR